MRITTKGFKAHDQDLELRRLNLLVGPNGSGKTTIADAIRMVALGYIPSLGKRPVDLAALMQGESMSVELALDNGHTIRRGLDRRETGYTASAEASWMRAGKPGEISKAITKLFGEEEQDVAEMLDIRELLAATPNQRAARMEQLLASGGRTPDEISKDVARFIVMRLAQTTEDRMPADYREALPMVPDTQKAMLFEQADMLQTKIAEAGIAGALTWANEEKRNASEGLKRKSAAAEELRKRAAQVAEPDERDITRLQEARSRLQQDLGAARQAWGTFNERSARIRKLKEQLQELTEISENTQKANADIEAVHGRQLKELEEGERKTADQVKALKMPPEDLAGMNKVEDLNQEIKALELKADAIELPSIPDTNPKERIVADFKARIELAEMSDWGEVLKVAQELEDAGTTKGIKTALAKPIRRLRELGKKGLGSDPVELKHDYELARANLEDALKAQDKATAARKKASDQRQEILKQADEISAKVEALRKEISAKRRKELSEFEASREKLVRQGQQLHAKMRLHRETLEGARAERESLDRRLASVNDQLRGAGELPNEPMRPEPIQSQLDQVAVDLEKLIAARATHTEIQQVLEAIEEAKAGAVVFTSIEWALQRQREIEISNAGGPLMRTMKEFLKAARRQETPFIRATQGNCAIGWKNEAGKEIQIQALSGGEWCLFACALSSAVILCRKSMVKILLVEAGETDPKTLAQLLKGIESCDGGAESLTAIVMSHRAPEVLDGAWNMVRIFEDK